MELWHYIIEILNLKELEEQNYNFIGKFTELQKFFISTFFQLIVIRREIE